MMPMFFIFHFHSACPKSYNCPWKFTSTFEIIYTRLIILLLNVQTLTLTFCSENRETILVFIVKYPKDFGQIWRLFFVLFFIICFYGNPDNGALEYMPNFIFTKRDFLIFYSLPNVLHFLIEQNSLLKSLNLVNN